MNHCRTWPNGPGTFKFGSNYGPIIAPLQKAWKLGFNDILWLVKDNVTEVGNMNFFVFWYNKEGEKELLTCSLDGTVLPGITRKSILEISWKWGEFNVTEREFTIQELVWAIKDKKVIEAFGAGTAA